MKRPWLIFAPGAVVLVVLVLLIVLPPRPTPTAPLEPPESAVLCPDLPFKVGDEVAVTASLAKEFGEGQTEYPAFRTGERVHVLKVYPDCRYIDVNGTRSSYQERIKVNVGWWTGTF